MAGYEDNKAMSHNARAAHENGLVTYSRLKAWQKRAVDKGDVVPAEWHHTGKCYNKTYFYDLSDFKNLSPKDYPKESKEVITDKEIVATYEWDEWGVINKFGKKGFKKHPPVSGLIKGEWFFFIENGKERKKSIRSEHMHLVKKGN